MFGGPLPKIPARSVTRREEARQRRKIFEDTGSRRAPFFNYWGGLSLWTAVHWCLIWLGTWALVSYAKYRFDFDAALTDLNLMGNEMGAPGGAAIARAARASALRGLNLSVNALGGWRFGGAIRGPTAGTTGMLGALAGFLYCYGQTSYKLMGIKPW